VPAELAEWWEDFALGDDDDRVALLQAVREQQGPRRVPAGTARRAMAASGPVTSPDEADAGAAAPIGAPPRKRRRRRRRPAGEAAETALPTSAPSSE
jgi:poly(A) polymerase